MLYYKTYTEANSQEWVVFIHGAGGSSSIWFRQIKPYIQHFNVLLLDLRGHGRSANAASRLKKIHQYTFEDVSRDVLSVLSHLNIQKAHFIGISLGTIIIRMLAEIAPECVKSMILGGAITYLDFRSRLILWSAKIGKHIMPFFWLYKICAYILMPLPTHKTSREMFVREAKRMAQPEFLRWFTLTTDLQPLLKHFNSTPLPIPTLYLMGDEDHMFLRAARQIVKQHPQAHLAVIPKSGHVCNVDQAEHFNQISIDFIYKNSH
ncbi:MAG: alpha/beta fold hydrolase [Bernardetiaceae bacterium]|nr:alpha/beta fold hydrolase [Bernardetiaceae bacterium]